MDLHLGWLRDYVAFTRSPEKLAEELTLRSIEVDAIRKGASDTDPKAVVAHVRAVKPHPNADRLRLATVGTGTQTLEVVCGAPNLKEGQKVVFLPTGATYLDRAGVRQTLESATIRGVVSNGMIASERELGLGAAHTGIKVLDADAPIGQSFKVYLGTDTVFELDVLAHRGDCMGHQGVAREVAAITGKAIKEATWPLPNTLPRKLPLTVHVADKKFCPRWSALVIRNVQIKPSPKWMQQRLKAIGIRPINNIVDITNYMMADQGQPLHAFDYNHITGHTMTVELLSAAKKLTTLDDVDRELPKGTGIIRDAERVIDLAGIMGGANSAINDQTKTVILQAAIFDPVAIRNTSRRIGHRTDAVGHFEKGLDPEGTLQTLGKAWTILKKAFPELTLDRVIDLKSTRTKAKVISYRPARSEHLLGYSIPLATQKKILTRLGCTVVGSTKTWKVVPPTWRHDLTAEHDIIEEVARIYGYDKVPISLPQGTLGNSEPDRKRRFERAAKHVLTSYGYSEVVNYSFTNAVEISSTGRKRSDAVEIENPLSREQQYLRRQLLPGMCTVVRDNLRYRDEVQIFEYGTIFKPKAGSTPEEISELLIVTAGSPSWRKLRGHVHGFLERLGVQNLRYEIVQDHSRKPYADQAVTIRSATRKIGSLFILSRSIRQQHKIKKWAGMASLLVDDLQECIGGPTLYSAIPALPTVTRDVACWVPQGTVYADVEKAVIALTQKVLTGVDTHISFLDEYRKGDKRSIALQLLFTPKKATLRAETVDAALQQVHDLLRREFGADIR